MELPDAETAWAEALRLVRDIEGSLQPSESWSLEVVEDGATIFRINLATEDMRIPRSSRPVTTMKRSKTL
ncbi:tRNA 5-methylaminomethyl-2-thiouridine synthase [Bradyrhizobium neotropicale]|nr:tRNA 5-methylaminomethyl-2-thiouridine synthase [Bradyrhizobium neotropicale]MBO4224568.1 tRNA 5-methylaminomethyl-2-thiouridine synthase [Bradyrhizobium neotropicale]